jgi:hypothetical protein
MKSKMQNVIAAMKACEQQYANGEMPWAQSVEETHQIWASVPKPNSSLLAKVEATNARNQSLIKVATLGKLGIESTTKKLTSRMNAEMFRLCSDGLGRPPLAEARISEITFSGNLTGAVNSEQTVDQ